jgi:mRNA interferase MazF
VQIVRGGVYFASLPEVGDKAVLVLSWRGVNEGLRSPIVCQVTRRDRERNLPTYVFLPAGEGGLPDDSYALCHEIVTLDVEDFRRQLGVISPTAMINVE